MDCVIGECPTKITKNTKNSKTKFDNKIDINFVKWGKVKKKKK